MKYSDFVKFKHYAFIFSIEPYDFQKYKGGTLY